MPYYSVRVTFKTPSKPLTVPKIVKAKNKDEALKVILDEYPRFEQTYKKVFRINNYKEGPGMKVHDTTKMQGDPTPRARGSSEQGQSRDGHVRGTPRKWPEHLKHLRPKQ